MIVTLPARHWVGFPHESSKNDLQCENYKEPLFSQAKYCVICYPVRRKQEISLDNFIFEFISCGYHEQQGQDHQREKERMEEDQEKVIKSTVIQQMNRIVGFERIQN